MSNRQNKQSAAEEVAAATRTLDALKDARRVLAAKAAELSEATAKLSYNTHALHDPAATKELERVRADTETVAAKMREHDYAIVTAEQSLAQARQDLDAEADAAQARELRKAVARFVAVGRDLDRTFAQLTNQGEALADALSKIHQHGSAFPTHQQLDVLGMLCVRTALQGGPWARAVERTAPNERRSFRSLVEGWAAGIEENAVKPRLGEQTTTEAA